MRRPAHTVAAAFVQGAVRALPEAERARVLRQVGIDPMALVQPGARVPAAAFGALWLAVARELDDEFFGLDARRMKPGSFALLCHAAVGQGTVERALRQALRGFNLFFDDLAVSLVLQGREARVVVVNRIDAATADSDARRFADETLLVMLNGLLCWLAGRRVGAGAAGDGASFGRRMPTSTAACFRPNCASVLRAARWCSMRGCSQPGWRRTLPA